LPRIFKIYRIYAAIKRLMDERRPDLFIPVDLPDFNMVLARRAKARGLRVLYYIAPRPGHGDDPGLGARPDNRRPVRDLPL
jgi:lipid-A-disaccharide synthase